MSEDDDLDLDAAVDEAPPDDAPDSGWRTLHPASPLVNLLPQMWSVVRQFWPLLLAIAVGGTVNGASVADLVLLGAFAGVAMVRSIVHWATLRWRLVEGRLEIVSGLVARNKRVIPRSKVQNVELVRNVFQRAAGLVEVRIETASGGDVEGQLSALSTADAELLVRALAKPRPTAHDHDADVLAENGLVDLLKFGGTSARLGAIAVGLGLFLDWTASTDPERLGRLGAGLGAARAAVLLGLALAGAWALALVNAVVAHHGFRLRREHDRLVAEEGLLTRRRVELPLHKVQVVSVRQPALRRLLGFGSIVIETAAARAGAGGTERALTLVPVVDDHDVDHLVREALPTADVDLAGVVLLRPDPRALRRGLLRGGLQGAALAGVLAFGWWPWGLLGLGVAWIPALLAWLDWRSQGWLVTERVVVARRGWLDRSTTVVTRAKLQAVELEQGPILRRWGLGEVVLKVAGTGVAMPLLDHDQAFRLVTALSASAAPPRPAPPAAPPDDAPPARPPSPGTP